jgi:hypothetical protein
MCSDFLNKTQNKQTKGQTLLQNKVKSQNTFTLSPLAFVQSLHSRYFLPVLHGRCFFYQRVKVCSNSKFTNRKARVQKKMFSFSMTFNQQHKNKLLFFFPYFFIEKSRVFQFKLKKQPKRKLTLNLIKLLNFYKIGLLLGFFIDAFKVGS